MNKYLEKLSVYENSEKLFSTFGRRAGKSFLLPRILKSTVAGAVIGGATGGILTTTKTPKGKDRSLANKILLVSGGAAAGAGIGFNRGFFNSIKKLKAKTESGSFQKNMDSIYRKARRNNPSGATSGNARTIRHILADLKAPAGFKTKEEAIRHYKKMASQYHPDRGGDTNTMQDITRAYREFKSHPEGFEKLASNSILEKLNFYDI